MLGLGLTSIIIAGALGVSNVHRILNINSLVECLTKSHEPDFLPLARLVIGSNQSWQGKLCLIICRCINPHFSSGGHQPGEDS